MHKFRQALYEQCNPLIFKDFQRNAEKLSKPTTRCSHASFERLSRSFLDKIVDNSEQVLYERRKSLIYKGPLSAAHFLSKLAHGLPTLKETGNTASLYF